MPSQPAARRRTTVTTFVAGLAWFGFKLGFGLTSLASVWASAVLRDGALWAKDSNEEKQELAAAQKKYWSLDREPLPGFRHAFFTTSTGTRLHFVTNAGAESLDAKNVAIFIHGFPDSFLLWRHILQSPELQRNHILIAVDIPGYGGSDGLPSYGAYDMLETMTEFILDMRKQYLQGDRKVVIATHDWGALIGARLASEAAQLADRWIITSGMLPHLAASNAKSQMSLAKQMLHTWTRSPFNLRLLKTAFTALGPVRSQFRRSFYIFCFQLPWPFSNFFATFGNYWFLRVLHSLGKGSPRKDEMTLGRLNPAEVGEAMAMSTGPSMMQLANNSHGDGSLRYGESVRQRVNDRGMFEKVKIYRDGLFVGKWEKSLETTAALFDIGSANGSSSTSSGPLPGGLPRGSLKAPTTFLLGERDPAFDRQLALNNAKDFLVEGSQVALVKEAGHWLPLEPAGRRVLEKVVVWALSDKGDAPGPFATMSEVRVLVET
ncbi:Alpha/Beta hydrolase protein [Phaeosphaeria sp. MPI-PUGE-AT-0046c]|nr:Alpha/Beta hydrolase protein [Phaeosphaeria sp. MPI-PUGE-AT-0046c]